MSYQTSKRLPLTDKEWLFSWGMVDNCDNLDLAPHFSPYLRNCRSDWQSIVQRPWHQLFAELTTWSYPKGIASYLRTTSSNDRIIVRHNKDSDEKLVSITEAWVVTDINTSTFIASDNRMSFLNIADVLYCMNGSDPFGKLSGTTYTQPSTWISSFAPSFWVVFNWCTWASWWSTNSNKVYKSVANNYEDFASAWSDTFTFPEQITGLATTGQALFYFTPNTISVTGFNDITDNAWSLTFNNRPLQTKEGAVNNASIVTAGTSIYYVTTSNAINKITQWQNVYWFEVMDVSERKYAGIWKIMSTLDRDQSASFGYFLPVEMLIKRHFKSQWSTFNDICIVYDIIKDLFLVDSQKYFYWGVYHKGKNYTISMIEPKVYQDEYSNDDEGSAIPFEYHTKEFYYWDPTIKKILWESRTLLDMNELATPRQEIWIDWASADVKQLDSNNITSITGWIGTQTVWEEEIWAWTFDDDFNETYILRSKWNLNKKGRKIQWRFINWVIGSKVRLKSINAKVEILDPLTTGLNE